MIDGLLLDTHVFLWWANNSSKLPSDVNDIIDRHYTVYLSSVVAWEIEIKQAKGKLVGDVFDWSTVITDKKLIPLEVSFNHVTVLRQLPDIHKDPFDRLLIAQAKAEDLQLVTHDSAIWQYPNVKLLKVSVLLKNGIVDPARLIFRSFIENYLHLKFILQENEDQYCLNFLYCIFAEKIKTYRAKLKVLNADSESQLVRKNYENIQRGLDDYNKKIQSDLFEESKQEYDRLNKPKINKNGKKYSQKFSWFTMHHPIKPRDLRNLAKCLESESLYTNWYKPLSSSTHAVDIISERIVQTDNPEKPVAMRPIRSYHSLVAKNIVIDAAISMIFLYDGFIKNFIPKELENFRIWSLKIEKHIELLDKERSEFFLKRKYNITS